MKEKPRQKQAKKKLNNRNSKPSKIDDEFFDLGIEPPKLYRQSQKKIIQAQEKKSRQNEKYGMTRVERRQKETKRREKKNKLRKTLSWIGAILVIIAIGAILCLTVFFQINNITSSGSKIYPKDKIISQCIIQKGKNLFTVDTDSAAQRIEENLPYVYKAEIKRKLPDTIEIIITDAKPSYSLLCDDNTYILLDDNFKVLEKGAQMATGIVINKTDIKSAVPGHKIEFKNSDIGTCLERLAKSVKDNNFTEIISSLKKHGYYYEGDLGIKDRHAFRYDKSIFMAHHLYVCPKYSKELKKHILFRNYLRSHEKDMKKYGEVKLKGASIYPENIEKYTQYKENIINEIYKKLNLK